MNIQNWEMFVLFYVLLNFISKSYFLFEVFPNLSGSCNLMLRRCLKSFMSWSSHLLFHFLPDKLATLFCNYSLGFTAVCRIDGFKHLINVQCNDLSGSVGKVQLTINFKSKTFDSSVFDLIHSWFSAESTERGGDWLQSLAPVYCLPNHSLVFFILLKYNMKHSSIHFLYRSSSRGSAGEL